MLARILVTVSLAGFGMGKAGAADLLKLPIYTSLGAYDIFIDCARLLTVFLL